MEGVSMILSSGTDPKTQHSPLKTAGKWVSKRRIGLIVGPVLFAIVVILPTPESMSQAAEDAGAPERAPQIALGTMLWILTWWITECVPLGIAALLAPLIFCLSAILGWSSALTSFMHPIIWIFVAGFVLATCFRKWDLDRRIAVRLGIAYKGRNGMVAALFVAALPVFILTMTGSITASTSVVFPFLVAYLSMADVKPGGKYGEACMLVLAQAATAGAMLFLISSAPNLIAKGTVEEFTAQELTFLDWLIIGTPHAIIGLLVSWLVVFKMLAPEEKNVVADPAKMRAVARQLGKMSRGEKTALGLLLLAIFLWILPSAVKIVAQSRPELEDFSNNLSSLMPEAMPAVLVIFLAGVLRVKGEPLLRWDEMAKGIDWSIVFLFGGGIVLGLGMEHSGFAGWLAAEIGEALGGDPGAWMIFAVACLLGFALTYAASNTAAALIACPIAATLALAAGGISPAPPIIGAALACSISSAIPSTTPPMAIIYSSGHVKIWSMFKVGLVSDSLRLAALIVIGYPLLNFVF
jgi:sodium-dependent dicarboxylate transporter 2/3/5